jgi:C-terminal processing protease CtpA/Prc
MELVLKILKIIMFLLLILTANTYADKLLHPYNLNFELGIRASIPEGWNIPFKYEQLGYKAILNDAVSLKGSNCMQLTFVGDYISGNFGSVSQRVDAKNYLGKKIIFKLALKTELFEDSSECKIWIKSNLKTGEEGTISTSEKLLTSNEWQYFSIESMVDNDAESFSFGITLIGKGNVFIDDVTIDYAQSSLASINKDLTALNELNLLNLTAFSKILGYIRYYYPSIELKDYNWDNFALKGTEYIENAKDKSELIDKLNKLFKPIAPAIDINLKPNKKPIKITKPKNALDDIVLSWLHVGADLGIDLKFFKSEIRNIFLPTRQREAPAIQIIDAFPLRGRTVEFSVWAKANVFKPDGHGQIWLGIDNSEKKMVLMETNADSPIKSNKWEKYSITATVPEDAGILRLGVVLFGDGNILFDDPELTIQGDKKNYVKNQGFEEMTVNDNIPAWTFPESSVRAGYKVSVLNSGSYKGTQSLMIKSDESSRIILSKQDEVFEDEVIKDVIFQMPLTLYVDSSSTLPKPSENEIISFKPQDFIYNAEDRYSRLSLIILLWNIQKQFALNIDNDVNWDEILLKSLSNSAIINNDDELITELNKMLTKINDGQSRAWINTSNLMFGLPILWKNIDGKIIISKVSEGKKGIKVGSELIEINDIKIIDVIEKEKETITGNTEIWRNLRALAQLRTGTNNKKPIKVKLLTPQGELEEHFLEFSVPATELTENRPPQFYKIQEDFYYLDLTKITDRGMKNLVKDLKNDLPKAKVMIFDLRGQTNLTEEFLGMFLVNGVKSITRKIPVFTKPNSKPNPYINYTTDILPKNPRMTSNNIFLIDERTSGLSEVIAGLVKHYKLGTLLGTSTSGTADEVFGALLPGNFNSSIIGMPILLEESDIDFRKGIEPDVKISPTVESIIQGRDEILDGVYQLLK